MIVVWSQTPATYREHVTDGSPCWCDAIHLCAFCGVRWTCIHGKERREVIVHRENP